MLYKDAGLKPGLLRSVESHGYKTATPIQEQVIKFAMKGQNIVGQSQTGTGKTAAFLLPVLNKIDTNNRSLQALIIAPTRELVVQIGDEIRDLTKYYGVPYVCLYGGASPFTQKKNLRRRPAIIVATPGRLMDFMQQKVVNISTVNYFILDEVDRMLDMGFVRDIEKIRAKLPNLKQTFTFSATMNFKMKNIIKEHIQDYEFIKVGEEVTVDKIHHKYMPIEHEHKLFNVIKLIKEHSKDKILIFTHTKRNTKTIQQILSMEGFKAGMLNGNMAQNKRQNTLNDFKKGKMQILVTTDVAARGLNMENVGLVINFEVPADAKAYVHRIGRTGRAGAEGKAIMLASPLEKALLRDIEKEHNIKIKKSEHKAVPDDSGAFKRVKLNRSTDKQGGRGGRGGNTGGSRGPGGGYKGKSSSSSSRSPGRYSGNTDKRRGTRRSSGNTSGNRSRPNTSRPNSRPSRSSNR